MVTPLIVIIIILIVVLKSRQSQPTASAPSAMSGRRKASAMPNRPKKPKASATPNQPKKPKRTKAEQEMQLRTKASGAACSYKAAYSKGRPDRLGERGDYEPGTPSGKIRVRCGYCGAENFVPAGSYDHYHCYFCWEKL